MDKVKEALETLHKVCLETSCGNECPLFKFCEYIWWGHFDSVWETVEDVFEYD